MEVLRPGDDGFQAFRIVRAADPEDSAFLDSLRSNYELNRPPRGIEDRDAVVHMGLSMYETPERAVATAQMWWPKIGRFLAEVQLVPGEGFNYTRDTGPEGHLTVWGRPIQLRQVVTDIVPIEEPQ